MPEEFAHYIVQVGRFFLHHSDLHSPNPHAGLDHSPLMAQRFDDPDKALDTAVRLGGTVLLLQTSIVVANP